MMLDLKIMTVHSCWFLTEIFAVLVVTILSEFVAESVYVVVSVTPAVSGESLPCVDLGGVTVI